MTLGPPIAVPAVPGPPAPAWRALVLQGAALAVLGVAAGLGWAALAPVVARRSDGIEATIAGEVTLSLLGVAVGLLVAVVGLVRPGEPPLGLAVLRLVGSGAASALAWGVGRLAGAPVLAAPGTVLVWPLTVAVVTALGTLGVLLVRSEP